MRAFDQVTQDCHGGHIGENPSMKAPDAPLQMARNLQVSVFRDIATAEEKSRHIRHYEHHVQAHMSAYYPALPNGSDLSNTSTIGQTIFEKLDLFIGEHHQNGDVEPYRNAQHRAPVSVRSSLYDGFHVLKTSELGRFNRVIQHRRPCTVCYEPNVQPPNTPS